MTKVELALLIGENMDLKQLIILAVIFVIAMIIVAVLDSKRY